MCSGTGCGWPLCLCDLEIDDRAMLAKVSLSACDVSTRLWLLLRYIVLRQVVGLTGVSGALPSRKIGKTWMVYLVCRSPQRACGAAFSPGQSSYNACCCCSYWRPLQTVTISNLPTSRSQCVPGTQAGVSESTGAAIAVPPQPTSCEPIVVCCLQPCHPAVGLARALESSAMTAPGMSLVPQS